MAGSSKREPRRRPGRPGASGGGGGRRGDGGRRKPNRPAPAAGDSADRAAPRGTLAGPAQDLPFWVVEALSRVTPSDRVPGALESLGRAADAFAEGRFAPALRHARAAKELAPRDATIRELIGLAAYRVGEWETALRELRTYRRLAGESTHMPIEMDVLRAMGRSRDVEEVWRQLTRADTNPAIQKEGRVVYASFLIDQDRIAEARRVVTPASLSNNPHPEDLGVWYVAAKAAALDGDVEAARSFRDGIVIMDPSFPGMDELDALIGSTGTGV